jgi:hypothetical protein
MRTLINIAITVVTLVSCEMPKSTEVQQRLFCSRFDESGEFFFSKHLYARSANYEEAQFNSLNKLRKQYESQGCDCTLTREVITN